VLSGRGLCDELITRPEESYWLWCVVVCDLETSWMRRPWHTGGCCAKTKKERKKQTNKQTNTSSFPCVLMMYAIPKLRFTETTLASFVSYIYPLSNIKTQWFTKCNKLSRNGIGLST